MRTFGPRPRLPRRPFAIAFLLSLISFPAFAVDRVEGEILVRFRAGTDALDQERSALIARGQVVKRQLALDYVKIQLDAGTTVDEALARLALDPGVEWAEANGLCFAQAVPQDPYLLAVEDSLSGGENQWGVFKTGATSLWRNASGGSSGTVIAIIDTGIDNFAAPHPDLAANVLGTGRDFVDDDLSPTDEGGANLYGHGTHVAGIAAAAANTQGIAGVAHGCRLLIARALDCTAGDGCPGTFEDIADAIQWAADQDADVINLSLGSTGPSLTMRTAIQYAMKAGAVIVAAAGNDSADSLLYPARYAETIAVGASDWSDNVAGFSNYGPELDVVAPGVGIWSTIPGPSYARYEGTSQATPFVSGIAALLVDRNPAMTPVEVETYLRLHAKPLDGGNAAKDGYGRVDFAKLIDFSDAPPPYGEAMHGNFLWEWLGRDASGEESIHDLVNDQDFRPNIGAPDHCDGADDGVFPQSFPLLPFLPPHIGGGASLTMDLSVDRRDGSRYGATPDKQLHVDTWIDWDSDKVFEGGAAAEHVITDHTENPATWALNRETITLPITPVDEHIRGLPLVVRTRLNYGASVGTPDGPAKFGEVEDVELINFVEDFDVSQRPHSPGVYTSSGTWSIVSDPTGQCSHHGDWEMARTGHPHFGGPCNGFVEGLSMIGTPIMNWEEYTSAFVRIWYCHGVQNCSPLEDRCRFRIDRNGVKIDLGPVPVGSGVVEFDLSDLCGSDAVIFEVVEETDDQGWLMIDDLVIWAYDGERPVAISNLGASRPSGSTEITPSWSSPRENEHIPTPPADGTANIYEMRFATSPIASEAAWDLAQRVDPRDLVGAPPTPGAPGAGSSATFRGPSAFQAYHLAVRTRDETTNLSALSNGASVASLPTVGVTVQSLGDSSGAAGDLAHLVFTITNTGNALDLFGLTATDTKGWGLLDQPSVTVLAPAGASEFILPVQILPGANAGDVDSVTVTATSLSSALTTDSAVGLVEVTGNTSDAPIADALLGPGLRIVAGQNPWSDSFDFRLALPAAGRLDLRVFDASGRLVRRLSESIATPGVHPLRWDGLNDDRQPVPSGVYLLEARQADQRETCRVLRVN